MYSESFISPPLGAHTSTAGGIFNAIKHGQKIKADIVQIFSKNQRQWNGRQYSPQELEHYFAFVRKSGIRPLIIHDSYLINLASPNKAVLAKSIAGFIDEIERASLLKIPYLLTHPGAHLSSGETTGIKRIAQSLIQIQQQSAISDLTILLETTAGQGSSLGYRFEHIRDIIDQSGLAGHLGVCIDTCHIFAAGYDIRTLQGWETTIDTFDRIIGLSNLKALHLNDSVRTLGSKVDRHARIGQGEIGRSAFKTIVNDIRMNHLPMILEVPGGNEAFRADIQCLRSMLKTTDDQQ